MQTHKLQENLTILSLLEEFSETNATVQQILCGLVQVRAKLRESSHLTVLSQLQLHGASHLYTQQNRDCNNYNSSKSLPILSYLFVNCVLGDSGGVVNSLDFCMA